MESKFHDRRVGINAVIKLVKDNILIFEVKFSSFVIFTYCVYSKQDELNYFETEIRVTAGSTRRGICCFQTVVLV